MSADLADRGDEIEFDESDIAVVGMSCRFPGARSPSAFWANVRDGVESIERLDEAELLEAGVSPAVLADPAYVRSCAPLQDMDRFDAEFFGLSPKDAAIMDPQHRHFLECAWEALEDAGHPPASFGGAIGVYAGCGMNAYMMFNLLTNPGLVESVGLFLLRHTGNDKDFLATRASFELNLRGPSVNVQTACSTSLVAVHLASQSLLSNECDLALAGGVTIEQPHRRGYKYVEGEILSPDGHCRAFDHRSRGTVFGSGLGVVVLRRMQDAIDDRDHIYAVVKASAINNDGSEKAGYLAPSVDGQAGAIAEALEVAGLSADDISYVECHGTGTPIGDPIEIAALSQAFRASSERTGYCGIGSVKTNIGHLDTAAGVASLIKVAQALRHRQLPPSLNFEAPNPHCELEASPFYVNTRLQPWPAGDGPRRAGVSSLGVGGTNAHVILEEAPAPPSTGPSRDWQLLTLSARNADALDEASAQLTELLRESPELDLADVAYTQHVGRTPFRLRRTLACTSAADALAALESGDRKRVRTRQTADAQPSLAFMLPGGGAQYPRMGLGLYESEPVFREHVDRGLELLRERHDLDLRALLFPEPGAADAAAEELRRPSLQLPALFVVEHALAQLWMSWGVEPDALVGHSMGENTAACIAGVMSFDDALGLVRLRGRLFETVPPGGMLSVPLPAAELEPLLPPGVELGAINGPSLCVASGPDAALDALQRELAGREIEAQRIRIDIAAHSAMLDPILEEFGAYLRSIELHAPRIPFVSNVSGTWIREDEATDPDYWVRHLRSTVRFAECVETLAGSGGRVLLEVGPGKTLSSLARQSLAPGVSPAVLASLRHPEEDVPDAGFLLDVLGQLWAAGVPVDWERFHGDEQRRRVPLPTYPFQRQRYWIEPGQSIGRSPEAEPDAAIEKIPELSDWFFEPVWEPEEAAAPAGSASADSDRPERWLVFLDVGGIGARVAEQLRADGHDVLTVREGDTYYRSGPNEFALSPEEGRPGYDALLRELADSELYPTRVVHCWTLTADATARPGSSFYHHMQERGFFSLLFLAQALGDLSLDARIHLSVVTNGSQQVADEPLPYPEKATLAGPCKVIPQEIPGVSCALLDVAMPPPAGPLRRARAERQRDALVGDILSEIRQPPASTTVALRDGRRWVQDFERTPLEAMPGSSRLRERGVYLITGGFGGLGLLVAEHLARTRAARLILVGRSALPARDAWEAWIDEHGARDATSRRLARLLELERLGAEVEVAPADVANLDQMRTVIESARARFGAIHGVFHAAGVLEDDLIALKTEAAVDRVFTPKIQGTLVLRELLGDADLDFVLLFSSTSSVLGAAGQVDYVAANAFMNAFARARTGAGTATWTAVNWGVWGDVGMAAEAARSRAQGDVAADEDGEPVAHPLLERSRSLDGGLAYESTYSPDTHWLLDQHRTRAGHAVVPGTGYLELGRAAAAASGAAGPLELRDVYFLAPLQVADGATRRVRVVLEGPPDDTRFRVESAAADAPGWELNAQGALGKTSDAPARVESIDAIRSRCDRDHVAANDGIRTRQEREHLAFGPRWRCLREIWWGADEALALCELPEEYARELDALGLHPALLDQATGYALELVGGYEDCDDLFVPMSYHRVRVHAPLTRRVYSHVTGAPENHVDKGIASFDVRILDEDGRLLVEVEKFAVKRLEGAEFGAGTAPTGSRAVDLAHASPAERAFLRSLQAGIGRAEGIEALERVLAAPPRPQRVVSSIELDALIAQVHAAAPRLEDDTARFARPSLASEYVGPRDSTEETLVGIWEELLGIDQVGIHDDFFELGGHSLIAVRLFAQVKKHFDLEYPISVLYEAPTIADFADVLREDLGDEETERSSIRAQKYRYLVPMHSAADSPLKPFFLIAGMFGNVLNLRHLADLIGADRPFYAIQARGLYGDDKPHERFEEMAADYIEEIRQVQPHGPYLIGGFSGGGISAYEVAQQLEAAGEQVRGLVLLDTPTADSPDALGRLDKLRIHLQKLVRRGPAYALDWARRRIRWELDRRNAAREEASSPYEFRSAEIEAAFYVALSRYETRPYAGSVALFRPPLQIAHQLGAGRAISADRDFLYPDNAWGRYLSGELEVHEVPGDHDSMVLEPSVRVLAGKLRAYLDSRS